MFTYSFTLATSCYEWVILIMNGYVINISLYFKCSNCDYMVAGVKTTIELTADKLKGILAVIPSVILFKRDVSSTRSGSPAQVQLSTYHVKPSPEEFKFKEPIQCKSWLRWFNMFRNATGLYLKSDVQQINILLYYMGHEAGDLLTSIGL